VKTLSLVSLVIVLTLGSVQKSAGQVRGLGFVQGKIVDDKGAPLPDVTCVASLPRVGDKLAGSSNVKGEWRIMGMAHGEWDVTCDKPGYAKGRAKIVLETELTRLPSVTIRMRPAS
jgi:hypothetical protein